MEPPRLRCLIVDDSAAFRTSARGMLEAGGITVVGTASTLAEALHETASAHPDVALVDIDLGGESGFDVAEALHAAMSGSPPAVVLVSTHDEDEFADMIDASSAVGFVPKFALSADRVRAALAETS
ncbi:MULTISPECIES: LytR/AlgR family response regulator transcription factor [Gordonia]|uniref:LytR/AlgR family response regulator transcription factor n=1 Tax=Gordonia TaxID=2053 RepID=UPI003391F75A